MPPTFVPRRPLLVLATLMPIASVGAPGRTPPLQAPAPGVALDENTELEARNTRIQWVDYRGRRALELLPLAGHEQDTDQEMTAVLVGSDFGDGVIEIDVAGARRNGYATDDASAFKGFVGLSFRVRDDAAERFYLRTENARLDSQLFRNRSTQYESSPDYSWQRLRQESPEMYESYVDLEPGAWTRLRIEVFGCNARLYVDGARHPALIVNDLKHGESRGAIALWTRISSDAYFSNLHVEPADAAPAPGVRAASAGDATRGSAPPIAGARLPTFVEVVNGHTETVAYRDVQAVKLVPAPDTLGKDEDVLALVDGQEFRDGTIEIDVAGAPRPDAPPDSRGFIGISFRTGEHGEWSEVFYLRPINGRANEQLRRNRSVQYASHPDYPWHRLRQESPGAYESYVDLETGAWTRLKIDVAGTTARLFVNGASQPCLIVTDLKHGAVPGHIALWAHVETEAYFGPMTVTPR